MEDHILPDFKISSPIKGKSSNHCEGFHKLKRLTNSDVKPEFITRRSYELNAYSIFTEVRLSWNLLVGCVACFLASPLSVRNIMLRTGLIASLFVFLGKFRQVLFWNVWKINAVIKRKANNCVGILSYRGEAATASNLSEYTITHNS